MTVPHSERRGGQAQFKGIIGGSVEVLGLLQRHGKA